MFISMQLYICAIYNFLYENFFTSETNNFKNFYIAKEPKDPTEKSFEDSQFQILF